MRMKIGRRRRQAGNIATELALAMPLLLLTVAGVLDFGMLYWEKHLLTNAAREGARAASRAGTGGEAEQTKSQVKAIVQNYLNQFHLKDDSGNSLTLNNSNYSYTWATGGTGTTVTISLTQIPYRMMLLPNARNIMFGSGHGGPAVFYLATSSTMAAEWVTAPKP